jgi:hypothetical protein
MIRAEIKRDTSLNYRYCFENGIVLSLASRYEGSGVGNRDILASEARTSSPLPNI